MWQQRYVRRMTHQNSLEQQWTRDDCKIFHAMSEREYNDAHAIEATAVHAVTTTENGINVIHRGGAFPSGQLPRCVVLDVVRLVRPVIKFCCGGELLDDMNDTRTAPLDNRASQRGMISQVRNMPVNCFHGYVIK